MNRTGAAVTISFAGSQTPLAPDGAFVTDSPLGSLLAPGVHHIKFVEGSGNTPELMMLSE
ncbi:MAG: hypothetical protein C4570_07080 [Ammonifex sp.]|nr:MAG: hypothetical protein C4570_07080 [Ammonifex sp.]